MMYPFQQGNGKFRWVVPYLVLLPALLFFLIFHVFPSIATFIISFTDMQRTSYQPVHFVGLDNYREFFQPGTFRDKGVALKNSIVFTVVVTLVQNGLALAVALILNQKWRTRAIFRALLFLPVLLGMTVNVLTWRLMFHPFDGPVQKVAQAVFQPAEYKLTYSTFMKMKKDGLPQEFVKSLEPLKNKNFDKKALFLKAVEENAGANAVQQYQTQLVQYAETRVVYKFLSDPKLAFPLIIFIQIWSYLGYSCVIYLAGLQSIPGDLYEAATVDGASRWAQFKHVTFPLIAQSVTVNVLLAIIGALSTFDTIYLATNGQFDTQTMAFYMFSLAFQQTAGGVGGRMGFASSVAVLLFLMIFSVAAVMQVYLRRREVEL
ncbi:ABC-type sugar transport system, permease component [Candidatus Moduliflexus flocculans]|uniref:ABC-type sugar transport system, permease component n=1 Tax=Candidatus Moduliflexus flocculans TaxID=1499966 RepID=A0A0S6W0C0_9BACT|nr:ABC-type sugar transport system, permease component [Candidatus Moduliflexus flocculans]